MKVTVPVRQKAQLPGSGSVRSHPSTREYQLADWSRSWTARTGFELTIRIRRILPRAKAEHRWRGPCLGVWQRKALHSIRGDRAPGWTGFPDECQTVPGRAAGPADRGVGPLRAAGELGISPWRTDPPLRGLRWQLMYVLHGRRHFGRQKDNLILIVPSWMPRPRQTIAATCVLELRTVGLLLPSICLAVLLSARLLANVKAPSAAPATAVPTRRPARWMTQPSW
jgi:hypothetical protein